MLHAQDILTCLNHYWGYPDLRPAQKPVIAEVMEGNSALVIMPTGGGKSMCYQLPAMLRSGLTLVISPLIALMKDQVDDLRLKGIDAAYLNSSQSTGESNLIFNAIGDGKMKLLYIAPERLMSLKGALLERLKTIQIDMIAVDEAHCISSWGHDFRPAYTKLKDLSAHFPAVPVLALTATADDATKRDIIRQLGLENAALFENSFDRPEIHYSAQARIDEVANCLGSWPACLGFGHCLLSVAQAHARNGRPFESGRIQGRVLPRRTLQPRAHGAARAVHTGRHPNHCGHHCFWHGHRQTQCAVCGAPQPAQKHGKLLSGNGASRTRWTRQQGPVAAWRRRFRTLSAHCEVEGNLDQSNVMLGKLRRMQDFADTKVCRRKVLLQYFGEELDQRLRQLRQLPDHLRGARRHRGRPKAALTLWPASTGLLGWATTSTS